MYTIHAPFQRFRDVHLGDLFGACGIYVMWDGHAKARPTYIGEGNILKRLSDHWIRSDLTFALPLDGYVAIVGQHGSKSSKLEARAVEYLLLTIGGHTDRGPGVNIHPGNQAAVTGLCETHGTLRVSVTGYDPLVPPWEAKRLQTGKRISVKIAGDGTLQLRQDWRLRKLRRD